MILIFISLINNIEHLFIYLLIICISPLEKYEIKIFAFFKIGLYFYES